MQKLQTKEKTFDDFLKRRGKIDVKKTGGKLSLSTLRLLNRYRDEWVFIQLESEWSQALHDRRANVGDVKKYKEIYEKDSKIYHDTLTKASADLLKAHGITQTEYDASAQDALSLALENQVSDLVWTYWAFKNSKEPKKLGKKDILDALKKLNEVALKNGKQLKELLPSFDSPSNSMESEKLEMAMTWLVEHGDIGVKPEDYFLAASDMRWQSDKEIGTATMTLGMSITLSALPVEAGINPEMMAQLFGQK